MLVDEGDGIGISAIISAMDLDTAIQQKNLLCANEWAATKRRAAKR
jgi:hypothetical protein